VASIAAGGWRLELELLVMVLFTAMAAEGTGFSFFFFFGWWFHLWCRIVFLDLGEVKVGWFMVVVRW
jgi:hypothetical protein